MPGRNEDVESYLTHYLEFSRAPHFAVLVKGPWGVGKTYLVNRFLMRRKPKNSGKRASHLYVSLYGISDCRQIEDAFFQQLHPVLSSKGMKLVASAAKGLLKTTVKIDLDHLGGTGATVSSQVPDIDLPAYLKDARERVLVFDDLERCSIPITDILGYINSLVEHDDCKVIVIANEDEILKRDGDSYLRLKEKLVGKTLEVRAEFGDALAKFTSLIDNEELRQFYTTKRSELQMLFGQSETENLRILQQTMWDFERVAAALTATHRAHDEAMRILSRLFFALSFEIKVGRLRNDEVSSFNEYSWIGILSDRNSAEPTPMRKLMKRYPEVDFEQTLLSWDLLSDILVRSVIHAEALRESLDKHHHFAPPNSEPAWRTLWYARSREDKDVDAATVAVEQQFVDRHFKSPAHILHVCGIRLWLSRIGAIPKKPDGIVLESKAYIDDLHRAKELLPGDVSELDIRNRRIESGGLGFHEVQTAEFRTISDHLYSRLSESLDDSYPQKAQKLMAEMAQSPDLFLQRVSVTNSSENHFASIPILLHIDPNEFIERVFALPRDDQRTVFMALKGRYEHPNIRGTLRPEMKWLQSVCKALTERASTMHPVARETVTYWINYYDEHVIAEMSKGEA